MPAAAVRLNVQAQDLTGTPTGKLTATATQASNRVNLDAALDEHGRRACAWPPTPTVRARTAAGNFDTDSKLLSLTEFAADYHDQRVALAGPARISVANGVDIQRLRLGFQKATLDVSGRVAPTLDITAGLHNLSASIANQFVPDLGAQGTVNADVRLTGSFARPTGTIRVAASGLRLTNGPAASFPAANVTANAALAGTVARVNASATAGSAHFNVTGTAPLATTGPIDLHTTGAIDLALLNRILAARGTTVHGRTTLDAAIGGTLTAPRAQGTLRLANGEVQDVVHGVHLQAITANVQAQGDTVRIERLSARAGNGTINASGSIGLAAPLPMDITLTAHDARPLASDLITTVLDANISMRGAVMNALTLGGDVTLNETEIRVPERLPSSVPVLNVVNNEGAAATAAAVLAGERRARPDPEGAVARVRARARAR